MPCDHVPIPGGGMAIVCSRTRRRPKCSVCGEPGADRECDTCDKPLHRRCATVDGEADYCPDHEARQLGLAL